IVNRREQRLFNRRLELSKSLHNPSAVLETLREERGFSNFSNPALRRLSDWLSQTGLPVKPRTLGLAFLILYLVLSALLSIVLGFGFATIALAPVVAFSIMFLVLSYIRRRRIFNFAEQLPDAVDIITRGVRAGLPFSSSVTLVAREMADPVATEFGMLVDEIAFGLDVRSALDNLYRRVGQEDLLFLTVAVSIQSQTGGNLGEILSRLSKLMRSRSKMRLKINALSAEGRLSAIALTLLPFALFLIINFLSPAYYSTVRGNSLLEPAIYLGLSLLLIGNIIMYRMVHFKY
ncbi:MAG: type II secretion system F family protein, partial [Xanthobacteraceae bacterium]